MVACFDAVRLFVFVPILWTRRATREGAFAPPEIFKAMNSNFDICRNFRGIKIKFYILIIFMKSYWNFSLSYW